MECGIFRTLLGYSKTYLLTYITITYLSDYYLTYTYLYWIILLTYSDKHLLIRNLLIRNLLIRNLLIRLLSYLLTQTIPYLLYITKLFSIKNIGTYIVNIYSQNFFLTLTYTVIY
jgi:hypothetical protein